MSHDTDNADRPVPSESDDRLIVSYLDGSITDEQYDAFCVLLAAKPELLHRVAELSQLDQMLCQVLSHDDRVELVRVDAGAADKNEAGEADPADAGSVLAQLAAMEAAAGPVALVDQTDEFARRGREQKKRLLFARRDVERRRAHVGHGPARPFVFHPALVWISVAALVGLVAWLGWFDSTARNTSAIVDQHETGSNALAFDAVLRETVGATWASYQSRPWPNAPVDDRTYELVSGLARFEMGQGVCIVVEGPARFRIAGSNQIVLESGLLTAVVPEDASGFTVVTPSVNIVDLVASFGVAVITDQGTFAQVFVGEITLTPTHGAHDSATGRIASVSLGSHQAAQVDVAGERITAQAIEPTRFVERDVFDALAGHAGESSQAQAVVAMWQRNPSLIAAESFSAGDQSLSFGWVSEMRSNRGRYRIESQSLLSADDFVAEGGRLVLSAADYAALFFDLDCSPGSRAAQAGLVVPDTRKLGRDGTRVCIAWTTQLEQGEPTNDGWFGLSLFQGGDDRETSEMVFLGQIAARSDWAALICRDRIHSPRFETTFGVNAMQIERGRSYRWLVVIDFQRGADRIAVYLDPVPDHLGTPDVVLTEVDLRFDRLRIAADANNCRWSVDGLRLGTDIESVLTD